MPVGDIVDERIVIRTEYHERHLVQQIPGARYDRNAGYWTAPLSWPTCIILRGLFGQSLTLAGRLSDFGFTMLQDRIQPAMELRNAMELSPDDPIARFIDLVESRTEGTG